MHAVAVYGHRHAVRGVGDADGPPRRQPDADGLPAAREATDVVGVDVDGEVRIRHQPMHLDGIAVVRRLPEIDDQRRVLGVVTEEPIPELCHEIGAEEAGELGGPEHAMEGVGADERHVPPTHARSLELVEDGLNRHPADRPEGSRGVIVEGDGHRRPRPHERTDARQPPRGGQGGAHGAVQIGKGRQACALDVGQHACRVGQVGRDRRLAVRNFDLHERLASLTGHTLVATVRHTNSPALGMRSLTELTGGRP